MDGALEKNDFELSVEECRSFTRRNPSRLTS
jgi:hypothetical protein